MIEEESRTSISCSVLDIERAMASFADGVDALDGLIEEALSSADGLVGMVDVILEKLISIGMAAWLYLKPHQVGIHPSNRYGLGIKAYEVHRLGAKIVRNKFSFAATAGSVCIEDKNGTIAQYTQEFQRSSNLFGKSPPESIIAGSVSSGHAIQFLVACLERIETKEKTLSDIDGRINTGQFQSKDKRVEKALDTGLRWLMVKKEAEERWPKLPGLIQSAKQATGQVQSEETHFELLLHIQAIASEQGRDGSVIDWARVKTEASKSESKYVDDIDACADFVAKYGGGSQGQFIKDLVQFVSRCAPAGRLVGGYVFETLCKAKLAATEMMPHLVMAVVKAHVNGPPESAQSRMCRFVTRSEIAPLFASTEARSKAMAAEKTLRHLHSVSRQIDIDTIERIPIIGKADQLIAMVLLGKKLDERYANIECVAHECIEALKAKQNGTIEIDNPYTCQSAQHDSGADGDSVKQTPFSGMLQYDASTGELANANICLLEQRGFKVDDTIRLRKDDEGAMARPNYGWFASFSGSPLTPSDTLDPPPLYAT
ncbi:unnamed protein product [Prorocentrum cordatum]|uniref:Uncharacterized protein n=1 Tax=Prorocentrum cordatum TaxID=2364126 RepID=A0ABN9Q375_9DINO|nr:unnamed protein product [Polarella glacialis]